MKYYWLTHSIDNKEIGHYPQCDSPKAIGNLRDLDYLKPIKNLITPEPVINPKAKLTTYIKGSYISSSKFLIIKDSFVEFLKDFDVVDFKTWDLKVHYKSEILNNYKLFHMPIPTKDNFIDFEKSDFYLGDISNWQSNMGKIRINDYSEYINLVESSMKENKMIKCNKLILNLESAKKDFFKTARYPIGGGYYVSEQLKEAIEEKKYTGMAFKEISELDKRIKVL
ncbi:hypothetical protein [uncultured Lacinutrix sp.]|uniref:hypothetical protein n=1 Tax=uncultured Lacinutrix sp. TaxID=574032 RepID=UPI00263A1DE7|nr:hypothetical protein [uncultured Lacinutrix sp.]